MAKGNEPILHTIKRQQWNSGNGKTRKLSPTATKAPTNVVNSVCQGTGGTIPDGRCGELPAKFGASRKWREIVLMLYQVKIGIAILKSICSKLTRKEVKYYKQCKHLLDQWVAED